MTAQLPADEAHVLPGTTAAVRCVDASAAAAYILGRQCPQGGFSFYRTPQWGVEEPNALDTFAAVAALRLLGLEVPQPQRITLWLSALQREDGSWPSLPIAWACCQALELFAQAPRVDPGSWLRALWIERLRAIQTTGRDWRGTLVELHRLAQLMQRFAPDALAERRQRLQQHLDAARTADGAWATPGADLESSGAAVELAGLAGLHLDRVALAAWWRRCEDPVLGLRLTPSAWLTSAAALSGGLAVARALGLSLRYADAVCQQIHLLQQPNGGCSARHQALVSLWDTWLALRTAADLALVPSPRW
ncbi:MAG: prenyltransferase/squalene oxidase repeat-containing protein [Thiomonas sp.]